MSAALVILPIRRNLGRSQGTLLKNTYRYTPQSKGPTTPWHNCFNTQHIPYFTPSPFLTIYPGTMLTENATLLPKTQVNFDPKTITLTVNGKERELSVMPWVSLLDALREHIGLTGTKKGCDHGQCGACTVLCDGKRILSCLTLAMMKEGSEITTIEGIAPNEGELHPLQKAFIEHDAFQCGYCTPGQICSAVGMLNEGHAHNRAEVADSMSGNLCRCGANSNILDAIMEVRKGVKSNDEG